MKKILVIIFISIIALSCTGCMEYINEQTVTCKVKDKWVKRYDEKDVYLISCDDEVYKIEDLLFFGKFDSSDMYASIDKGKTYKITTTGYRMPYLSEYKNINKIEEVKEKK